MLALFKLRTETCWYILFCFLNGLLAAVLCLDNFPETALFWSIQSALFSVSASFSHFFFLFLLVNFPFWLGLKFTVYKKLFKQLISFANILLVILVYLDTRIYELYKFHLNGMVIELITGGALQDNLSFEPLVWILFLSIAIAFIFFEFIVARLLHQWIENKTFPRLLSVLALVLFVVSASISQGVYMWSDAKGDVTITSLKRYIPWAQTVTAKRRLKKLGVEVSNESEQHLAYDLHALKYPKHEIQCNPEKKYNIIILVVDSLRFDMLSQEVMPSSYQLAQRSHIYQHHYSLANSTRFGIFTLLYGLPGNYWHGMVGAQQGSVFINELDKQGYEFFIHSAAPLYSPEFDRTVFAQTRDYITPAPEKPSSHEKDSEINKAFIKAIKQRAKTNQQHPFFAFLFYDSPHSYSYPKSFDEPFSPSWSKINYLELDNDFNPEPFFNRYKNSVAFTDSLLEKVYKNLEQHTLLTDTIIVFTGDHGQEFNETKQNFWGHNGNFSDYQTKVPLFIYWPETHPLHGQSFFQHQTASIDIVPTLMNEVLHCENPIKDYALGLNLYDTHNNFDRPLLMESWSKRAIMGNDYIMVSHDAGGKEVFNRDYTIKENFETPQKDFSIILKQMSEFNQK